MRARVKDTGEIVEVELVERKTHTGEQVYMTHEGCLIEESRLDFNAEPIDYWTRLEHQYAGMAMQGIMSYIEQITPKEGRSFCDEIVDISFKVAHALVEKMKENEKAMH